MAVETDFEVNFTGKFIVKATNPMPDQPHILTLSNLDLLSGRFPVTYFYFYPNKPHDHDHDASNFTSIIESLKTSLANTLDCYYPFCGRIVLDYLISKVWVIGMGRISNIQSMGYRYGLMCKVWVLEY
ncbi:hypothetical protein FF1_031577 [Malus domestica]